MTLPMESRAPPPSGQLRGASCEVSTCSGYAHVITPSPSVEVTKSKSPKVRAPRLATANNTVNEGFVPYKLTVILLRFTGPPVPITARVHSTPPYKLNRIYTVVTLQLQPYF
eukprot:1176054-Prorocentrum_minimum.AAC.1